MKIYADTSVLFSLYVTDANSPKADACRLVNRNFASIADYGPANGPTRGSALKILGLPILIFPKSG